MTALLERVHTDSRHYSVTMPCDFLEFGVRAGDVAVVDTVEPLKDGDFALVITKDNETRICEIGLPLPQGSRCLGKVMWMKHNVVSSRRQEDATPLEIASSAVAS